MTPSLALGADTQLIRARFVALALRAAGRETDASRLLSIADREIRGSLRRGPVPAWSFARFAQVWAVHGRRELALSALERATSTGWLPRGDTALADIADEPAFQSLRGHPRFERIRARINAHRSCERRELTALPI